MSDKIGAPEAVLREFPAVGKYRIRIVQNPKTGRKALDIREYAIGESFEGFTRRGVRLADSALISLLRDELTEILNGKLVP